MNKLRLTVDDYVEEGGIIELFYQTYPLQCLSNIFFLTETETTTSPDQLNQSTEASSTGKHM